MRYAFLFCLLTGCARSNETFDCEPGRGVGCVSLSHVNEMVDTGDVPLNKDAQPIKVVFPGAHLRVWVAEHVDEDGVCHESSVMHVPLDRKKS